MCIGVVVWALTPPVIQSTIERQDGTTIAPLLALDLWQIFAVSQYELTRHLLPLISQAAHARRGLFTMHNSLVWCREKKLHVE